VPFSFQFGFTAISSLSRDAVALRPSAAKTLHLLSRGAPQPEAAAKVKARRRGGVLPCREWRSGP